MIGAEADFWESAVEVAVTVTVKSLEGRVGGAVYVAGCPLLVAVGEILPQEFPLQVTAQVTLSWPGHGGRYLAGGTGLHTLRGGD